MKIIKINENYAIADVPFESHKRGKNYAALITGLDEKFGLKREWLEKSATAEGRIYLFSEKPSPGQIVEIRAIYYSGSGHPSENKGSGFYRLEKNGLTPFTKNEVLATFQKIEAVTL